MKQTLHLGAARAASLLRVGRRLLALAALLAAPAVATAQATFTPTILGLGTITGPNFRNEPLGAQGLVQINPNNGSALNLAPVRITGVAAGQTLVGIDFRPANNLLYALGYDAALAAPAANTQLYILDPGPNTVTAVGAAVRLELGGAAARVGFDFNPTVDRIRVTSTNRANYRLNPNDGSLVATDGTLTYAAGTAAAGLSPFVSAVAYTNSFVGSTTTALYDVDYRSTIGGPFNGILSQQTPANSGTLDSLRIMSFVITGGTSPGTYGVGQPDALGMDIYYDPSTNQNVGYLTEVTAPRSNGRRATNTYRLDLRTGQATQLGNTVPSSGFVVFNFEIRDLAVAIAPIPVLTWDGSVSTAWRNPLNWTPNIVPALPNNVIIPGGTPFQPTVSLPQQCSDVTLGVGAVLTTAPGGTLVVGGDFANNGGSVAGSGDGTVLFNLNVNQTIGGTSPTIFQNMGVGAGTASLNAASLTGPVSVRRLLTLYGNLNVSGQTFTLLSDANNTAAVINFAGIVNGPVTVQRYIEPSRNGGLGYRHYTPPVSNTRVSDFAAPGFTPVVNNAFNAQGTTAMPFPNVYGYDQARVGSGVTAFTVIDQGYFSPVTLNDALNSTQGYTVNINAPVNVDFVGSLVNGPVSTPGLPRSAHPDGGWHLRGNPYPAPLDWQLMINNGRLTNINPALYIFKSSGQYTGSYGTYIGGISANGGSNLIPTSQGFYVRTAGVGQTGRLDFTNAERLTTYVNPAFQRGTADRRPQLGLSLHNATATLETVVYFDPAAAAAYQPATDASYLAAKNGLLLASEAGAEVLAINAWPR